MKKEQEKQRREDEKLRQETILNINKFTKDEAAVKDETETSEDEEVKAAKKRKLEKR